jgi:hypothetical protein
MRIRDYSTVTANPRRQLIATPEVDAVDQIVGCDLFKLKFFKIEGSEGTHILLLRNDSSAEYF